MESLTEQQAFDLGSLSAIAWISQNLLKHSETVRDFALCKIGLALFENIALPEQDLVEHTARLAKVVDRSSQEIVIEINKKIKEGLWKL